jgi:hypothetical protein
MSIMSDRFNRTRWSDTRKAIDALKPGQSKKFPEAEFFNCHSSVMRLNDAYDGERKYELSGGRSAPIVKRIL